MKKLTINSIECKDTTNISNGNDVFFMVQLDGGAPIRYPVDGTWTMDDDDKVTFPHGHDPDKPQFAYSHTAYVSVWDSDGPLNCINQADMLGNVMFETDAKNDDYTVWGVDGSKYKIDCSFSDFNPPANTQDTQIPTSLQASITQAVETWSKTDEGKKALGESDPSKLQSIFQKGLLTDIFEDLVRDIAKLPWVEAVSLGISAQAEIFVGMQGDFGVVMDLADFPNSWSVYVGGGFLEGVEGGVQGAINFGVWSQKPQDIGGWYEGIEVDVTDVAGFSAAVWVSKGDKDTLLEKGLLSLETFQLAKAVFVGIDIGVEDGVSAEEIYLFAGHLEDYPSFQSGTYKNMAVLTELKCKDKHSSLGGHDDVHILWTVDKESQKYRYPIWNEFEMDDGDDDEWQCGTIIKFDDKFKINLFAASSDTKDMDDTFELDDFDGVGDTKTKTFKDGGTEYELTAKLLVKG